MKITQEKLKMILVQIQDAYCIELYCLKTHLKAQSSVKKTNLKVYGPLLL